MRSQALFCFVALVKVCPGPQLRECSLDLETPALYFCGLSADIKAFLESDEPSFLHGGGGGSILICEHTNDSQGKTLSDKWIDVQKPGSHTQTTRLQRR